MSAFEVYTRQRLKTLEDSAQGQDEINRMVAAAVTDLTKIVEMQQRTIQDLTQQITLLTERAAERKSP